MKNVQKQGTVLEKILATAGLNKDPLLPNRLIRNPTHQSIMER